jgi:hypothetical protein
MIPEETVQGIPEQRGVAQMGARVVWDHEVAGSIPVTPTIN